KVVHKHSSDFLQNYSKRMLVVLSFGNKITQNVITVTLYSRKTFTQPRVQQIHPSPDGYFVLNERRTPYFSG
ncbi:hypothetical protein VIGAN_09087100, partial [Vigna angularis var. angularis]